MATASWTHGAGAGIPEYGSVLRDADGWGRQGWGGDIVRVAVESQVTVVAAKGDLSRVGSKKGFLPTDSDGEFSRLDIELDPWEKQTDAVEEGAVGLAPEVDERVGEIAGGSMGESKNRCLEV